MRRIPSGRMSNLSAQLRCDAMPCDLGVRYFSVQQSPGRDAKRPREPLDNSRAWIARASFDIADIGAMDSGLEGIVFLT